MAPQQATGHFIAFINYCNTQLVSVNDYTISRALLSDLAEGREISIEAIAERANISPASVSRFIRKAGFSHFHQAVLELKTAVLDIRFNRQLGHQIVYPKESIKQVADSLFERILINLTATKEQLDFPLLFQMMGLFKKANSITFLGDEHGLSLFFTLQLDLMAKGKVSYLYYNQEIITRHKAFLRSGDVVVFIGVSKQFIRPEQLLFLEEAKAKGVALISLCQDRTPLLDSLSTLIYPYGVSSSGNDGYYSLNYLSNLLSEMVVTSL